MLANLRHVLKGHGATLAWVALAGISLNGVFAAADPLIMKYLIDEGLVARDFRAFGLIAVVVVVFSVLIRLGLWVYELMAQKLRNRITESLALRMLGAFHALPYEEVRQQDDGYFLSRVFDEPNQVAQGLVGSLIGFATQAVTFLAAAAVAIYLNWRITLILSVVVPLLMAFSKRFAPRIQSVASTEKEQEARMREGLGRVVEAYTTTRVFALQPTASTVVRQRLDRYLSALYDRVKLSTTYTTASTLSMSLAEAVVLLVAGYEVIMGRLSIGGLFGFMKAFWKVISAFSGLVAQVPVLAQLNGYIERIREFEGLAEEEGTPRSERLGDLEVAEVRLSGCGLELGGRQILRDFSLTLQSPSRTLILGDNGAGKSTLTYLMAGFLSPDRGIARIPSLSRISALLTPFSFLPSTLRDNVRYDELGTEKRALFESLAQDFGLADKTDRDLAKSFSEGEKKKAQILMTLLQDADVYLFDEPLAHVDNPSKGKIVDRIIELTDGKILVLVMHGDEAHHGRFERIVRLVSAPPEDANPPAQPDPSIAEGGLEEVDLGSTSQPALAS